MDPYLFVGVTANARWATCQPEYVEWMRLLTRHVGSVHTCVTGSARAVGTSAPAYLVLVVVLVEMVMAVFRGGDAGDGRWRT